MKIGILKTSLKQIVSMAVIVASLGYFVDIYDLVLFGVVRMTSLKSLGFSGPSLLSKGVFLLNMQMTGMLIGGLFWGILGDKKGRVAVLFGSIFLYSTANIANAFVHTIPFYAFWRLVAGIGLAGELGAGITLVAESLSKETRGYATTIVATVGVSGAVVAGLVAEFFSWRMNFFLGGLLGFLLLALRLSVKESGLFENAQSNQTIKRGEFLRFFTKKDLFFRYVRCILIGLPLWFVIGILVMFSPELSRVAHVTGPIEAGKAIMWGYAGLVVGDCMSGVLSQITRSRKKILLLFLALLSLGVILYVFARGCSPFAYYCLIVYLGIASGYWALFATVAAEQFGTNMRATASITIPNFVRGGVVPMTLLFQWLAQRTSLVHAALYVGIGVICLAGISMLLMEDTYGKDLQFYD